MPRKSKSKIAPRGEGGIPAPKVEPKIETPKIETPKPQTHKPYVIEPITNEEYIRFGNRDKSEVRRVAEEIIARVLESDTPLKITLYNITVRQILPVLSQLARELKNEKPITIDFKVSIKENTLVVKKVSGQ